jgi:asparagine synthase (glutamine-hydrolysing)
MCGINGIITNHLDTDEKIKIIRKMNETLSHRGPDNEGLWHNDKICLGHRRLSIIDLSPESNQPFLSSDNRYVIVYNGELYNYKELKLELQRTTQGSTQQPYFFKTNSDTEVILAAFMRWGRDCLQYFNGMFAFAICDIQEDSVFVARDRVGIKPLYYHYSETGFIFSSEIRPILQSNFKPFKLNHEVVAEYAMYQTVFAPNTIIKGIYQLMPGHYMMLENNKLFTSQYYSLNASNKQQPITSYKKVCEKVNELLSLSVQRRLVSDVPFGAFLSGGIDSSAIVGLMSKVSTEKIQTFNISFDESEFSESKYAKIIAKKFNTQHHEIKLNPESFLKELPNALNAMDHPSGDGPNTYIVSKATKSAGISMALSGIGGDELFAGYDVFKRMMELQKKSWINHLPLLLRKTGGKLIQLKKQSIGGNKIEELLSQPNINFNSTYPLNRSLYTQKELLNLIKNRNPFINIQNILKEVPQRKEHLLSAVSIAEINTYLQNTLLRDTDQMSMAVALEVREPFLDYKLIEYVLELKDEYKLPHSPKKLLVDSLGDLLPGEIVNRPKMGFTLPWQHWLKNDLKLFCEENMIEFANFDFCNKETVINYWKRFNANDPFINWSRIWHLIVLNNWIKTNKVSI